MKEDMLEVLIYLFENYIIDSYSFEPGQEELAKELVSAGFPDGEVDKAFVWLEGLLEVCERDQVKSLGSRQHLVQYGFIQKKKLHA